MCMDICSQTAELVLLVGEEFTTVKLITSSFYTKFLLNRVKVKVTLWWQERAHPNVVRSAFCIGTDARVSPSSGGLKMLLMYTHAKRNLSRQNEVQIKSTTNIRCSGMVV